MVAGIRTPQQITIEGSRRWAKAQNVSEAERRSKYPSLEEVMPAVYKRTQRDTAPPEQYFKDMQDIEFTIQDGKLWMLQCRNGKRTGAAMVKIAMDMLREGLIDEKTCCTCAGEPAKLDELLHPVFDKTAMKNAKVIVKGLPASPGAATGPEGKFFAEDAEKMLKEKNQRAILVRIETFARRPEGHARRRRHPDRTRRHDLPRRGRSARHGQVLRIGCRRAADRLQGTLDPRKRI